MNGQWPFGWLRRSAAQWFVRLRSEPVTPRLDAKFKRWLASNPAHEVDYERQELAWELAGELAHDEEMHALLADAERAAAPQRGPRRTYVLAWSAAAATLVAAVGVAIYVQWPSDEVVYATAAGEQRTVVLPDQSRMALNTSTRARVVFERSRRIVELDSGEATFSVTRDEHRPFEVRAAGGIARALGTEFNVFSSAQNVTVSVLSGKVEVVAPEQTNNGSGPQATVLLHDQAVTYDHAGLLDVEQANAARIRAWHSGRIAFENLNLQEALREFNRYGNTPIVVADPSLMRIRISGTFRIGETDALLQALNTAFEIEAEPRDGAIALRARE